MDFTLKTTALLSDKEKSISVKSKENWLTIEINDEYDDQCVISLSEPHRSEFIRRIKELKTND